MSDMSVNHSITTTRKAASTAMFSDFPLRFIKAIRAMMKCRGTYHVSDVLPVFMFMHDQANAHSPNAQCHYPPLHASTPKGRGRIFVLAPIWEAYE